MKYRLEKKIKTPFFVVSPKSYIIGNELIELAKITDELAQNIDSTIFFSAPPTELINIVKNTKNLVVTSQSADGNGLGRGMGRTLLESLKFIGVGATFLNHMEAPISFNDLISTIERAKELEIVTIVCADTIEQAKSIAYLKPDIILCEQNKLIGTGQTSNEQYIIETTSAIKKIDENILVMQGAGITTGNDVAKYINLNADGTGISSVITSSSNKKELLKEILSGLKGKEIL